MKKKKNRFNKLYDKKRRWTIKKTLALQISILQKKKAERENAMFELRKGQQQQQPQVQNLLCSLLVSKPIIKTFPWG